MFHSTIVFSLLALASAGGYYQSPGSQFSSCILCGDGGDKPSIQSITFRNTGPSAAQISVFDVACSGCGFVQPGGDITLFGTSGSGGGKSGSSSSGMGMGSSGFPTNTNFIINGQSIELHTSCSRPLGVGTTVGQFTIVGFVSSTRSSASCGPAPAPPTHRPVAPPTHPVAPPTHPYVPPTNPPTHPYVPPTHPYVPPTNPPTHPVAPPTHPYVPPTHPYVPPTSPPSSPSCSPAACAYASRIHRITLEFTSNVGRGSFHPSQDSHVLIQELSSYQNSARVVVMSTQSATGVLGGVSTNDFRVHVGQQFTLQGARGSGEFGASVLLKVGGKRIRFNTNCNAEVNIGDEFGSVRVVGYENSNGVSCGAGGGYRKARSLRGRQL